MAVLRVSDGRLYYETSGSYGVGDLEPVKELLSTAKRLVVEKPGGTLYGKVRYDHLVMISVNAGRVFQMGIDQGLESRLVNAHGPGGWRPALLKSGKGYRRKGQEVAELEALLPYLIRELPLRNGRLKGVVSEHQRDALGIAVAGALGLNPLPRRGKQRRGPIAQ